MGGNIYKYKDYMAGTVSERLEDLHNAFANNEVKAIIVAQGGAIAFQLLEGIDYELIKDNPKIITGFSDPSILVNAIHAKTGLVTFHGPMGSSFRFAMSRFTIEHFKKCVMSDRPMGSIKESHDWSIIREGFAEGQIIGANLRRLQMLLGTPYEPQWEGKFFSGKM